MLHWLRLAALVLRDARWAQHSRLPVLKTQAMHMAHSVPLAVARQLLLDAELTMDLRVDYVGAAVSFAELRRAAAMVKSAQGCSALP